MLTPRTVTNALANTVEVPTADEFTVSVHCPLAFVGPVAGAPQVPPVIDPGPDSDVKVGAPTAGVQPVESFFSTVMVKVCAVPTLFTPVWAIVMRASTQVFWLATLNAPYPKVEAVMLTPLGGSVALMIADRYRR